MKTRENAIVDSLDFPSTTTENKMKQNPIQLKILLWIKTKILIKNCPKLPSLKTPLTVNDSSVFCKKEILLNRGTKQEEKIT